MVIILKMWILFIISITGATIYSQNPHYQGSILCTCREYDKYVVSKRISLNKEYLIDSANVI